MPMSFEEFRAQNRARSPHILAAEAELSRLERSIRRVQLANIIIVACVACVVVSLLLFAVVSP